MMTENTNKTYKYEYKFYHDRDKQTPMDYVTHVKNVKLWVIDQQWEGFSFDSCTFTFRFKHQRHYTLFLLKWG